MLLKKNYFLILLFLFSTQIKAQQENQIPKNQYSIKSTDEKMTVDGVLDETTWGKAITATNFWMSYPVDGELVNKNNQTEVKMAYDDQYLYIGAVCHGSDNYIIQTLKRDNNLLTGDAFGLVIDPVNERTNGFVFGVNPMGVQTEMLVTGQTGRRQVLESGQTPKGVNVAWDNKWLSEVKRYSDRWEIEIAIPFKTLRFNATKPIWGINFFRSDAQSNSIHTWAVVPIEFIELDLGYTGSLVWDKPPQEVKSNISVIPYLLGGFSRDFEAEAPSESDFQAGVDGKIALTSSLNFDLTVNPDFSQVEVDEQVTNLTLFDIRLPEKRLFFLENSDIFEDFGIPPMRPFFSRKIGLDKNGTPIPILFGARLSGNINKDLRVGLMNMQTRKTDEFFAQNYTAVAFHQQVLERSVIKGYIHNRDAISADNADYNRNAGLEFLYRSNDGRIESFAGYAKSFNPGVTGKNYFFNLGSGYDSRNISVYTNFAGTGVNYIADMGFFRGQEYYDAERDTTIRIGYNHWFTRFSYTLYADKNPKIISHEFGGRYIYDFDGNRDMLNRDVEINYNLRFANTSLISVAYANNTVNLLYPFAFTENEPLPSDTYNYSSVDFSYESDQRKLFSYSGGLLYGDFFNGTRSQVRLGLKYRIQPWGNFALAFEHNNLEFPDPYGKEKLILITPRIDFNFSRNLFWTTFMQYNTQGDNFNINSRLQWRFRPMSDIFLVYTDNYGVEKWFPKNRAVVLKLNYWLNL